MIRFQCDKCGTLIIKIWPDIKHPIKCRCTCGTVYVIMAATEEDLLRKAFKKKEAGK